MNEDSRDDSTLLGLAAVAVLAALCIALAAPNAPADAPQQLSDATSADEAQWLRNEQPAEQLASRREQTKQRDTLEARRRAEEAELAAMVKRSEAAVAHSRRAAAELEASVRALRPDFDTRGAALAGAGAR
jgi:hypothetical protein